MPGPKVAPADFRRSNYANLIWAKWRILADALTAVGPHVKVCPSVRMQNVRPGCSKSSYRSHNGKPQQAVVPALVRQPVRCMLHAHGCAPCTHHQASTALWLDADVLVLRNPWALITPTPLWGADTHAAAHAWAHDIRYQAEAYSVRAGCMRCVRAVCMHVHRCRCRCRCAGAGVQVQVQMQGCRCRCDTPLPPYRPRFLLRRTATSAGSVEHPSGIAAKPTRARPLG